jgi:hypothetical protein
METTAAISLEAIEQAIAAALGHMTGLPVISERAAGPRPAEPFVSFLLAVQSGTNWPIEDVSHDANGILTETITDPVYFTCQISAFGAGCIGKLHRIRLRMASMQRAWDLSEAVGNSGFDDIQNTTREFQGEMLVQATVAWHFYAVITEALPADYFSQANYTIQTSQEAGFGHGDLGRGPLGGDATEQRLHVAAPGAA